MDRINTRLLLIIHYLLFQFTCSTNVWFPHYIIWYIGFIYLTIINIRFLHLVITDIRLSHLIIISIWLIYLVITDIRLFHFITTNIGLLHLVIRLIDHLIIIYIRLIDLTTTYTRLIILFYSIMLYLYQYTSLPYSFDETMIIMILSLSIDLIIFKLALITTSISKHPFTNSMSIILLELSFISDPILDLCEIIVIHLIIILFFIYFLIVQYSFALELVIFPFSYISFEIVRII